MNGFRDNTRTAQRERYRDGRLVAFISGEEIIITEASEKATRLQAAWRKPWGTYSDVETMGKSPEGEKQ